MEESEAYQRYLDRVISTYASERHRDEMACAKSDYLRATGEVHEDDAFFELRMASFFEWYLFDRPLNGDLRSPVQRYYLDHRAELSPEERAAFQGLVDNIHSLFEVKRRKPGFLVLADLLANVKREVVERRARSTLEKGDLFEARLIPHNGALYFTRAFCFFPPQARSFIHREAKRARKVGGSEPAELLRRLAYLRYLQERFRHVDLKRIYSEEGLSLGKSGSRP
jgi:hypothetical protein